MQRATGSRAMSNGQAAGGFARAELRAELAPVIPVMPVVSVVDFDKDAFEERAAILEYDAGFSRDEAERRALALMSAENLLKPTVQAPPVESAVAPPLPVAKPEIVCCGDCAHSVLPPDTCPTYGWRLCGLGLEGGGGFGRAVRRCEKWRYELPPLRKAFSA